ncbi:MAG: hypothetical protein KME43_19280 [Myxacorys chilensis ATA2-1-KO14]|nr:hypothetical protein [Myxacorys chilensis ATA2-1-KO14]
MKLAETQKANWQEFSKRKGLSLSALIVVAVENYKVQQEILEAKAFNKQQ